MRAGLAVVTALLALPGCTAEPEHGARPTVVSLNPCTDAVLVQVADAGQLLALSHYSHDPRASSIPQDQARRFRVTGGTVEEVLALRPDVVVAGTFMPPATAAALRRLGVRVELFGIAATVAESEAQVRRLAAIAGHADRGDGLVRQIDAAMARSRFAGPKVPAVLWQQGGIVAGDGSLIARLLAHTGFANHAAARGLGQAALLPLERVLADPPAVVLTTGDERALRHPALARVPGLRHARLDPSLLYCGGPTIIRAVDRLAQVRRAA